MKENAQGLPLGRIFGIPVRLDWSWFLIFGLLPPALGLGAGSEFRSPMADAVIGGLITSSLLTLVVVTVAYTYLDDLGHGFATLIRRWTAAPEGQREAEVPAD